MQTPYFLYVLECEQYYKIGISNNPKTRFTAIRTANPFEVKPVLCIYTYDSNKTKQLEKIFHSRFIRLKHRNEWFIKSDDIINLIKSKVNDIDIFLYNQFEKLYYGVSSSPLNRNRSDKIKIYDNGKTEQAKKKESKNLQDIKKIYDNIINIKAKKKEPENNIQHIIKHFTQPIKYK